MMSEPTPWQPIETLPERGNFLVYLSTPHLGCRMAVMNRHPKITTVGGILDFDLDGKPTHWRELPEEPTDER
jgi:hypothetical protein